VLRNHLEDVRLKLPKPISNRRSVIGAQKNMQEHFVNRVATLSRVLHRET
jgi:hypothetical protein